MPPLPHEFTFPAPDGAQIFARRWLPNADPKAIIQIAHGVGDHSARYTRFAEFLARHNYATYASDHRAHGRSARSVSEIGRAGPGTFDAIVNDLHTLTLLARHELPARPIILFGHSLGSLLAQRYIQLWGPDLAAAVLSGTFGSVPGVEVTVCLADALATGPFADARSPLFWLMFKKFNSAFRPARTSRDWLSRDPAEVDKVVADPFMGKRPTSAFGADILHAADQTWRPENERRIPPHLPVLFISGSEDPTTERTAASSELFTRYRRAGMTNLQHNIYPGARHELLNETNRDEVMTDVVTWIDKVIANHDASPDR